MLKEIMHIGITISDMERSISFYRDILGLNYIGQLIMEGPETDALFHCVGCKVRVAYLNVSSKLFTPPIELIQFLEPRSEAGRPNLLTNSISKDMSRLGRDYLKVGFYTEVLFVEKEVRFIAINNGIDSANQQDSDFTPFLNIINEWYAKDTSKKIRAVMKSKGEAGEHLCTNPPYGYMKDPDNKKWWIVDEEAARVVRRIFSLCLEGYGPTQIARILKEEQISRRQSIFSRQAEQRETHRRIIPTTGQAIP